MVFRPNKLLTLCVQSLRRAAGQWPGGAAAAPCLSVLPCLVAAAADKVVNGSLFALPVDRGVNNNYFNNSLAAIYRMLNETVSAALSGSPTLFKMYICVNV